LSAAHRTRHKRRNHQDFHDVRNNIQAFTLPSLTYIRLCCLLVEWVPARGIYGTISSKRCVSLRVLLPIDFTWSCEICWPWLICSRAAWVSGSSTRVTFGARRVVALPVRLYSSSTLVTKRCALAFSAKFITSGFTCAASFASVVKVTLISSRILSPTRLAIGTSYVSSA